MRRVAFLFAGVALLAGCQVGPAYHRPAMPNPGAWTAAVPDGAGRWPDETWWAAFGSSQLNVLVQTALNQNTDIAAAAARIEEADGQARIAGAALLPSVGANVNGGAARQLGLTGHERHHAYGGGVLQAQYELDFWGKNLSARQAAEASASAARFDAQVVKMASASAVVTSYIAWLGTNRQIAIIRENLQREQQSLDGMQAMLQAGLIPRLEVAQQDVLVQTLAASLSPLAQQAEHLHTALAILLGELPEQLHLAPEKLDDLHMPQVAAGLPSQLLLRRPDVQQAEALLQAANANIRVARADFFPSLNLTASGGLESYALTHYTVPPLGIYSLAASLTQPIFEGGRLEGQMQQAKARYTEQLAAYRKAAISAFGDVENALSDVAALQNQEAAETRNLDSARLAAQMGHDAYHAGQTNILSALTGEDALFSAEQSQAQARVAHLQAFVALDQALGGGWTAHGASDAR